MSEENYYRFVHLSEGNMREAKTICKMLKKFYDNEYDPIAITENQTHMERHSFIAYAGRGVNMAGFILVDIPENMRNPYILQLLVAEKHRGNRVGYELLMRSIASMEAYEADDETKRYNLIYLNVPLTARDAIKLYERNGFKRVKVASEKAVGAKSIRMQRKISRRRNRT